MEQMLTAKEVAKALCLTDQTVYRLIAAGKLRSYRVGLKKIAIDAESVKKYLGSIIISYKNDLSDE